VFSRGNPARGCSSHGKKSCSVNSTAESLLQDKQLRWMRGVF
jgi:hypothetical protein